MPNEAQNILEKAQRRTPTSGANRTIAVRGDDGHANMSNMPFLPPSLQWRGRNSLTTRQFLAERNARVASKRKHVEISMESPTIEDQ